jgi:hypothetical protein
MKSSKNNPWAAMDAIVNANLEPTGKEWFTGAEYATRYGCSPDAARYKLTRLKSRGLVEQWTGSARGHTCIISKWRAKSFP